MESNLTVLVAAQRRPEEITIPFDAADVDYLLVSNASMKEFGNETVRALIKRDFDVVLTHQTGPDSLIASVFAKIFRTPVVMRIGGDAWKIHTAKLREFESRGQIIDILKRALLIILNRLTHPLLDGYIPVSTALAETVERKSTVDGISIQPVVLPIKKPYLLNQGRHPSESNRIKIMTVTNLDFRGKFEGLKRALNGVEEVLEEENAEFHIYGGGSFKSDLEEYIIDNYNILYSSNRINIHGYTDNTNQIYKEGDIFVYYSYNDGYPNVVLEASSAGLPVISNPDHGMKEQVIDGETGYLIPISNKQKFVDALESLCESQELRHELGISARDHVRQTNNPQIIGEQLVEALRIILDRK